jgi:hypothetical protein
MVAESSLRGERRRGSRGEERGERRGGHIRERREERGEVVEIYRGSRNFEEERGERGSG